MPTYEYACKACGHGLEAVQKFTDDPLTECPDCGGELRKVFRAPAIAFKGSGFYKTDSRASSGKSGSERKEERKESATSDSSGSGSGSGGGSSSSGSEKSSSSDSGTASPAKESTSKESKPAAAAAS